MPNASALTRIAAALTLSALALLAQGCGGSASSPSDPPQAAVFLIRTCVGQPENPGGELFRVQIRDPAVIAEAQRLTGAGNVRIVGGRLAAGNGGFNQPWSWHIDPNTVEFADATIEICDGCPQMVEDGLQYWLGTVGSFCPWSTEVLRREQ